MINDNEQKTTTIKDIKEKLTNSSNLEKTLKQNGWKDKIHGHFSTIYEKDGEDFIIKINILDNAGYELFLSVVRRNKNKHFPIVYEDFIVNGKDVYFVEKLEQTTMTKQQIDDIEKYYNYVGLIGFDGYQYAKDFVKVFRSKQKSLADAIDLLHKAASDSEYEMDIQLSSFGNEIMKRKDGTLVIKDPFAEVKAYNTAEEWEDNV